MNLGAGLAEDGLGGQDILAAIENVIGTAANVFLAGDAGANRIEGGAGDDLLYGFDPGGPGTDIGSIAATRVAAGLTQPVFVASPTGDTARLFIVEKLGDIKILDLATNAVLPTPFLSLGGQISTDGEGGLLGLAFHPDFAQNGLFFVNLINTSGDTEIRRYQITTTDPNRADAGSGTVVLTIDQPGFSNHKAGWLGFGPDGYLYASLGDGGSGGDPFNNGQNPDSLLGKMLRLDVDGDAFPADAARNYAIPADNPFVGTPGADEIWALGLRNPWRPSFDRATGELYIADVGQNAWEEINIGQAGANYGWGRYEGPILYNGAVALGPGTLTFPVHVYGDGVNDNAGGFSITGGYVYRGPSEGLQGRYFFGDFIQSKVWTLEYDGANWVSVERTGQIVPSAGTVNSISSFGEDATGNLYIVDFGGEVFRLTPGANIADQADALLGNGGDDTLFGGPGDDTLDGGAGEDTMFGSAGNDTYVVDDTGDVITENPTEGTDTVQTALQISGNFVLGANLENLTVTGSANVNGAGNTQDNVITGNPGNNFLDGGEGNDTLAGSGGDDALIGRSGMDHYDGGAGVDTAYYLDASIVGSGSIFISGHIDRIADMLGPVDETRDAAGDTFVGMERLWSLDANVNDSFRGTAGDDVIVTGGGDDDLVGRQGADVLDGGDGFDTVWYESIGGTGLVVDWLLPNASTGEAHNDILVAIERVFGAGFNDEFRGGNGNEVLAGGGGDDILDGRPGDDILDGGPGNDIFIGGLGRDVYIGQGGNDRYIITSAAESTVANPDIVVGFETGIDKLDLTLARTGPNDSYVFVAGAEGSYVYVDLGGDGGAWDMAVDVRGAIVAGDLLW